MQLRHNKGKHILVKQNGFLGQNQTNFFNWASLFSGLDYWTGTLDWTTGMTYFWVLHILWLDLRSLASKNPLGTCSPLLNTEDKQWNMRKRSLNNFATVHYATIQHLFLTWCVVMLQAVQGIPPVNVTAIVNQQSTSQ